MTAIDGTTFTTASSDTANSLTKAMILHPIVCGMAFIAFLMALGAGVCGSLMAALTAGITWALSVVALATDFVSFGIIRSNVNDVYTDSTSSYANYSVGMWTMLAGMLCLFFATFIVFFSCCSACLHRRSNRASKIDPAFAPGPSRGRFWQRSSAY
jgi:hypothetical protein